MGRFYDIDFYEQKLKGILSIYTNYLDSEANL